MVAGDFDHGQWCQIRHRFSTSDTYFFSGTMILKATCSSRAWRIMEREAELKHKALKQLDYGRPSLLD